MILLSVPSLTTDQWLGLVHPVLIILFVYPVVGATIRLGILARERRLDLNPIAPTVPVEHADHGRWVTGVVVLAMLIGMAHDVATAPLVAGDSHFAPLMMAGAGVIATFAALLRTRPTAPRLAWAFSTWLGLLLLSMGLQGEIGRRPKIRRLHVGLNLVVALLLATQAISGTRNLLS